MIVWCLYITSRPSTPIKQNKDIEVQKGQIWISLDENPYERSRVYVVDTCEDYCQYWMIKSKRHPNNRDYDPGNDIFTDGFQSDDFNISMNYIKTYFKLESQ